MQHGIDIIGAMDSHYVALFLLLAVGALAQKRDADFNRLADRFFDEVYFNYDPVVGHLGRISSIRRDAAGRRRARRSRRRSRRSKKFEGEVEGFDAQGLSPLWRPTANCCSRRSAGSCWRWKPSAPWEKNPDIYSSGATNAIFVIMSRTFAPPAERLKSVIAREKADSRACFNRRART